MALQEVAGGIEVFPARQENGLIRRPDLDVLLGDSAHHVCVQEDEAGYLWVEKPTSRMKAYHERDMYERLTHDGVPVLTFPKGQTPYVEQDDLGEHRLVLPYVADLQPLTRQNWQGFPGTPEFDERATAVTSLFSLAAKLHLRGYVHGDFQIKNVGSLRTGKLVMYDLERADETRRMDSEQKAQAEADDLVSVAKSLLINRFLERLDPLLQLSVFEDYTQHYIEKRKAANFDAAFAAAALALGKIETTLQDAEWLPKARARFLASRPNQLT